MSTKLMKLLNAALEVCEYDTAYGYACDDLGSRRLGNLKINLCLYVREALPEINRATNDAIRKALKKLEGAAVCSSCGNAYMPKRAPKTGQRNYCPKCREAGIPLRDAQRAMSERRRRANG